MENQTKITDDKKSDKSCKAFTNKQERVMDFNTKKNRIKRDYQRKQNQKQRSSERTEDNTKRKDNKVVEEINT